jgi:hypothetical protein
MRHLRSNVPVLKDDNARRESAAASEAKLNGPLGRVAACGEAISNGFSGRAIRIDRSNGSFHKLAAARKEAWPNGIFGTVAATSGEARLCGMLGTTVIATYHF